MPMAGDCFSARWSARGGNLSNDRSATHSAVLGRSADGCIARMMLKPNGARLTSDAALLHLQGIGLLVCHVSDHADDVSGAIKFRVSSR
jgi:hypothetical protein